MWVPDSKVYSPIVIGSVVWFLGHMQNFCVSALGIRDHLYVDVRSSY